MFVALAEYTYCPSTTFFGQIKIFAIRIFQFFVSCVCAGWLCSTWTKFKTFSDKTNRSIYDNYERVQSTCIYLDLKVNIKWSSHCQKEQKWRWKKELIPIRWGPVLVCNSIFAGNRSADWWWFGFFCNSDGSQHCICHCARSQSNVSLLTELLF